MQIKSPSILHVARIFSNIALYIKRSMKWLISPFLLSFLMMSSFALAQDADNSGSVRPPEAAQDAGSQTLETILERQRGLDSGNEVRKTETGSQLPDDAYRQTLGTLGLASDADIYRQIRFSEGRKTVSTGKDVDTVMLQPLGMAWLTWRSGPLLHYTGYAIGGIIIILCVFFLVRGRIRIEQGRSGNYVSRFNLFERAAHWTMATTFVILALTGILMLFGRLSIIPLVGKDGYAVLAEAGKFVHNWLGFLFVVSLVVVFVQWVLNNIPRRADIVWLLRGGGIFSKGSHVPAWKFNAGQKLIFWFVISFGSVMSVTGISLILPFEFSFLGCLFSYMNMVIELFGVAPILPENLLPIEEMQYFLILHAIFGVTMMAVMIGHIYIGTIGMEGAFEAMGKGKVDANWAKEHHSLWYEQLDKNENA